MEYLSKDESQEVRIRTNRKRNYYGNDKLAFAIQLYVNGMSIKDVAKRTGITSKAISDIVSKHWFYQKINEPVVLTFESNVQPLTPTHNP